MNGLLGSTYGGLFGGTYPRRCSCTKCCQPTDPFRQLAEQMRYALLTGQHPGGLAAALGTPAPKPKPSDHATRNPPSFSEATASRLLRRSLRAFQPKR